MRNAKPRTAAVLVKIVGLSLLAALIAACTRRPQEHAPPPPGRAASSPLLSPSNSVTPAAVVAAASAPASAPASAAPSADAASSAYAGCGQPIPSSKLWDETSEREVLAAISAAKACAATHDRRVLLEFVAPWCEDCQEMAKLDETDVVAATLKERFERVRVNVGKWDRHEGLRNDYEVHALATYVVLDPKTSRVLAKTTLEPITKANPGKKLTAPDWAHWLAEH
jgi:thiol:disulfide interchange protein